MNSSIHHMTVIRYYRDSRPWKSTNIDSPTWNDVEAAIRRMDNYCYPVVELYGNDSGEGYDFFIIIGGAGRFALLQHTGEWQYEDPDGGEGDVRLWESDQGYFCKERNIITDVEKVLRITKAFYVSGSYDELDSIE